MDAWGKKGGTGVNAAVKKLIRDRRWYLQRKSGRKYGHVILAVAAMLLVMSVTVKSAHKLMFAVVSAPFIGTQMALSESERSRYLMNTTAPIPLPSENLTADPIQMNNGRWCKIPRILHQTYKTDDESKWPVKEWARYRDSWLENHPESAGWHRRLWDDENNRRLVSTYYPEYLHLYDAIKLGVSRADFARMLYMHLFGGVYADMDVASFVPLEVYFNENEEACERGGVILGHMGTDDSIDAVPNAFLMSEPGHPLWRYCIESAPTYAIGVEARYGPVHLKHCVKAFTANPLEAETRKTGGVLDRESERHGAVVLAPTAYFFPFSWNSRKTMPSCNEYRNTLYVAGSDFADVDLRLRCEDELKVFAGRSLLSSTQTAPITYTMWCHSWGQFVERNNSTKKVISWMKRVHPRLGHL